MWQKLKKYLPRKGKKFIGVLLISPLVTLSILGGSYFGLFHVLEWGIVDLFVRRRPKEPVDQRIVIVTIDESDIENVGEWPMPDRLMAKMIRNIKQQNPRLIGLDIYRDLPVEPGHEGLVEVFKSTPNLIGIEKVAPPPIKPPPALAALDRVGANDMPLDKDGKVRRGFVLIGEQTGFATQLALKYLEQEGIHLEVIDENKKIYGLGQAVFVPLTGKEGEYRKKDTAGYQILFNYRGELDRFLHISLTDVLNQNIPANFMSDRIVLIGAGVDAPSLNDYLQTPYSTPIVGETIPTPGVVVHANLLSQIINAALENRPMIKASPKLFNGFWILFWSGCSSIVGVLWLRQPWAIVGFMIAAGSCIILSGYFAFFAGWWIPIFQPPFAGWWISIFQPLFTGWWIPIFKPLFATVVSMVITVGYLLWENLNEYAHTLEHKVKKRTAQLAKANQAITELNKKLQAENLRMSAELEVTKRLQKMILPKQSELDAIEELDIAGFMEPADEVGGDYYDIIRGKQGITIGIGDVTGHGLESGVLMIMAQTAVRALTESRETDPVKFLDVLNRTLYHNVERMNSDKNMTLALLEYANGMLKLSGQHEEMIVVRANKKIERIDTLDLGFPIGLDDNIADFIDQESVKLNPGDGVVLYTDGITEAENLQGELYGLEQLCQVIRDHWQYSALKIRQAVIDSVRHHIGEQKVFDDITLVVLKQQ